MRTLASRAESAAAPHTASKVSRAPSINQPATVECCEQLFLEQLPTIRRIVSSIGRRHRLAPAEVEDFTAEVQLRLISDDYGILRKFQSRCSLRTFLTVVIQRMFLDYRNTNWGKWRPSLRSRREGRVAVLFERLTVRDGLTFEEACSALETDHHVAVNRDWLERIYGGFRLRMRPRFVSDEGLEHTPVSEVSADAGVARAEANGIMARTGAALGAAVTAATPQDRLILKLHFCDGLSIAAIARRLHLDQKQLYRRLDRTLRGLRSLLESSGVLGREVLPVLGRGDAQPLNVLTSADPDAPSRRSRLAS